MNDTRRDKRAPVSLKVRFKSATLDEFREQYSIDISRGGLFIKSKSPMGVGTLLKFEFQLKDKSRLIHGVGRVVWVRAPEQSSETAPPGMGIKFIKMDPESRALVQEIVDGRGDVPGRFDEGSEDETSDEAPATAAAPMFPDLPPAELPPLEDRTAVRHASEFLASALAAGEVGAASAAEAEQIAEEARQREAARAATEIKLTGAVAEAALHATKKTDAAESAAAEEPSSQVDPLASTMLGSSPVAAESADAPAAKASERASKEPAPAAKSEREKSEGGSKLGWVVLAVLLVGGAAFGLRAAGVFGGPTEAEPRAAVEAEPPAPPSEASAPPSEAPVENVAIAEEAAPEGAAEAAPAGEEPVAAEALPEGAPTPEAAAPAAPVEVRVESNPRGAEIRVGGSVVGQTPATISLRPGVRSTLVLKAPGYAAERVEVTPGERTPPVRATLTELPYRVTVESTPPGALARIGNATTTTPGTLTIGRTAGNIILRVSLANHLTATESFTREAFVEEGDAMRHAVSVTLTRAPARSAPSARPAGASGGEAPAGSEAPAGEGAAPAPAEPSPAPEPAAAPAPAEAAPAP